MNHLDDTIAAVATPPGKGSLAVLRISGKDTFKIITSCFLEIKQRKARNNNVHDKKDYSSTKQLSKDFFRESQPVSMKNLKRKKRFYGIIVNHSQLPNNHSNDLVNAKPIDEVVLSVYHKPYSYTGEDVIEINCHCNAFIIKNIMQVILLNARLAKPGEFTQRAFLNNKIDLTQAEAVRDIMNVKTVASHQAAISQLEGSLHEHIKHLLDELTSYRVEVELEIDFNDQDVTELDIDKLKIKLSRLQAKLQQLIKSGKEGIIIREGLIVCLAGAPNVGKSSLFNSLLESDRAIVTTAPGTTRDFLEESLSIDGYLVRLIDTAGLRKSEEYVESLGIGISYELIKKADKVLYLEDSKQSSEEDIFSNITDKELNSNKFIKILNKCDIIDQNTQCRYVARGFLPLSTKTGLGIDKLREKLLEELTLEEKNIDEGILTNIRQLNAAEKALHSLEQALMSIEKGMGHEFTAFDLKVASESLEEIIGKVTDEDILNKIFNDFCIGK